MEIILHYQLPNKLRFFKIHLICSSSIITGGGSPSLDFNTEKGDLKGKGVK